MGYKAIIDVISVWIIPAIILIVLTAGLFKKLPIYEIFIDGAKDGIKVGVGILPYLIAIIVAVSMLRASGAIEALGTLLGGFLNKFNIPVDTLPIMIIRPLSGSAILGILSDIAAHHDVNSYITKLSAVMVGSSETTFYVLAVYFGSVGIKKVRHSLLAGLLAETIALIAAIIVSNIFFL